MSHKKDIITELQQIRRKVLGEIEFASDAGLEEKRQIRVIAASGRADRTGDIVSVEGIELANFKKNPIILWAHDHYGLPIARAVDIRVESGKLTMLLEFASKEVYEFADTVYKLVKGGFLKGVSIGARVLEAEWILDKNEEIIGRKFNKLELLELSVVAIPADSKALITAVKSGKVACTDLEACLEKTFDAPLDFLESHHVESNTHSVPPYEETDMGMDTGKIALLEQRVADLELLLKTAQAKSAEEGAAMAGTMEKLLGPMLDKLGVKGTGDLQSRVLSMIESMTQKATR